MSVESAIEAYRVREEAFFGNLDEDTRDAYLYGEVGFCLLGLKPCVLIDLPSAWLPGYLATVVQDTPGLDRVWVASESSEEMHLRGRLVLLNPAHAMSSEVQHLFQQQYVSEIQLATVLDYPGRLPAHPSELEEMREVAYTCRRKVLTTFAAQADQLAVVQRHFNRYRDLWQCYCPSQGDLHLIFRIPK